MIVYIARAYYLNRVMGVDTQLKDLGKHTDSSQFTPLITNDAIVLQFLKEKNEEMGWRARCAGWK
jgi:hypothetical protein